MAFSSGARTRWHTHPLGQTLIVVEGLGWVQEWGVARRDLRPGDVVWIPPGIKHWHGATPTTDMTHAALQDHLDGRFVTWLKEVGDAEYAG